MNTLSGVWAASVTPFNADLSLDHDRLASHVEHLLASGCHGVVLLGTTGEANSLSVAERLELMDRIADTDLPRDRLLVGTGCTAHPDSVSLTSRAVQLGFRGVLLLPPFYYKSVTDDGLFESTRRLIEEVADERLRILLYHFPRMAGVGYSHNLIARLMTFGGATIEGIKDSTGDADHMYSLCENFPSLRVFVGTEKILAEALAAGAAGCISASVNVTSALCRKVYDGISDPSIKSSPSDVEEMRRRRTALEQFPFSSGVKAVISQMTGSTEWLRVRPPLDPLSESEADLLFRDFEDELARIHP